jgi:signal transduction histidine kinase/HD-like signal output (HDOD) protein
VRIASEFTGRVQLSVFPYLLEKLIHTRHEPGAELPALSRLIGTDPALCFMAMRLDRSMGSRSLPSNPTGVDEVVSRIGMAGVDAITTQVMADQALNETCHRQGVALGWLWRHGLTTALLARGIAMALKFRSVEEAYIAGLLHDIGKLALAARTPAACAPMLADSVQANPLIEAEAQVAGSGHDQIGALLLRRHTSAWFAADAARYHTATAEKVINALPLVQIVWAANRLTREPQPSSETHRTIADLLNLPSRQLDRLARSAEEQALAVAKEIGGAPDLPEKIQTDDACTVPLSQEITTRTVLSGVYAELLAAADRSAIIRILRQSLSVFFGIDSLVLVTHEPESNLLVGCYATGTVYPDPIDRLRIPLTASDCLPVVCLEASQPIDSFSRSRQAELTIIDRQLIAYTQKDGMVCVPVRPGINNCGTCLLLGVDADDWPWIEKQTTRLTAITAAVAGALEREHRKHGQIRRRIDDPQTPTVARTRKIVHEINNPLSIIKNYLKVLTLRTDEKTSGMDELRIIDEEINRVTGLIKSLTAPTENIPGHLETLDVNATITDILGLFRKSLPAGTVIRLEQDLDTRLPAIVSDRNRLKQALINLLKNAMEAIPDGGTIHVSTSMLRAAPRQIGSKDETGHIKISVCDNGPGIDEGMKNKLFKPNVTSKTGHDGLGLSIVHEAVTYLNGFLLCESITGRGTCFHIELPTGGNASENGTESEPAT